MSRKVTGLKRRWLQPLASLTLKTASKAFDLHNTSSHDYALSGPEDYGTNTIRDLNHHCDLDLEESKANRAHDIQVKAMHNHTSLFDHKASTPIQKMSCGQTGVTDRREIIPTPPPPPITALVDWA